MATISTHPPIEGYPFNNIFSVSDGMVDNSTGVPYFYLSELELSVFDIHVSVKILINLSYLHNLISCNLILLSYS